MTDKKTYQRLSDLIVKAFDLAVDQKDAAIADLLRRALEMTIKRNASGRSQVERRSRIEELEYAVGRLEKLKKSLKGD